VSLVVEHDPISLFDGHGGLVQTMTCDRAGGSALGCHMLENTICNLLRHCGDADGSFASCKFELEAEDVKISEGEVKAQVEVSSALLLLRELLDARLGLFLPSSPLLVPTAASLALALAVALVSPGTCLRAASRRAIFQAAAAGTAARALAPHTSVADDFVVLTDEEMAARVRRKEELLRAKSGGKKQVSSTDVRSDVNPDAGLSLRSRSLGDNYKASQKKAEALKEMSRQEKRDELCEMLGRGC